MFTLGAHWKNLAAAAAGLVIALMALPGMAGETARLDSAGCLTCHGDKKAAIAVAAPSGTRELAPVDEGRFARSLHAEMQCTDCHQEIVDSRKNHAKAPGVKPPNCVSCHEALWAAVKKDGREAQNERLGLVVQNIEAYRKSLHATPDKDNPARPKAWCEDCHSSHAFSVPPKGSEQRTAWHKEIPALCGENCHDKQLRRYKSSAHAEELFDKGNIKSAVCIDCHTAHSIGNTSSAEFKINNVNTCGGCHKEEFRSYTDTYHGQVNRLGFAYTAKCFDCHESHAIRAVTNAKSTVNPKNKLKTCRKCHTDEEQGMHEATAGFASFGPHANSHDYEKYPQMYIASKFMAGLLIFVFLFFWAHSGLWYYREWNDRKQGKPHARIDTKGLQLDENRQHFRRFHWGWRLGHLAFALVTMTLVLTGTSALYAQSAWAPYVAQAVGGPKILGLIHRVSAALFVGIFLIHFVYVMQKLLRDRHFRWFGPDSLIPNWKDFKDCWGMFKWFMGKGPKPLFDRWAYFEKFDYWAVFWGFNIIGWSGLMLAFPHVTAQYLPGWVFNVGTLVHGEEAFLAAVFLFTVHFFNNHFRPDKLPPPDVVMFTGTQSLREFRHDHPAQYQRLVDSGELKNYLVEAPSPAMTRNSKILGLALIAVGLTLLVLVGVGFFSGIAANY
ncbi:MAG TPA: cytochrome b/b6 domain-containing protein [Rhodocyclaceae bacterium]